MKDKFKIDEEFVAEGEEIIDEILTDAVREVQLAESRMVAMALLKGYDGVDIDYGTELPPVDNWMPSFTVLTWNKEPQHNDRYRSGMYRYDFRELSEDDKNQLLSLIGASVDDIPENDSNK